MASYDKSKDTNYTYAVQSALQSLGANLGSAGVDGKWGAYTEAAYQANKDAVDAMLSGGSSGGFSSGISVGGPSSATSSSLAAAETGRPTWAPSDELTSLKQQLTDLENSKPGAYESKYQAQIDDLLNKILNREQFTYDFNADPLYQQYKDRYTQQGKMAMQDTMAQAAALTGGYGNSYAQTVGQQTYQGYLQGLNDVIPELRNQAYQMYQDEGDRMTQNLGLMQDAESINYGQYRDTVADYWTELNYFYNKMDDMSDFEFQKYASDLSAWQADRAYWYNKYYDEQQQANWEAEFGLAASQAMGGGGTVSSSSGSSSSKSSGSKKGYVDVDDVPTGAKFINPQGSVNTTVYGSTGAGTKGGQAMNSHQLSAGLANGTVRIYSNGDGTYEYRVKG